MNLVIYLNHTKYNKIYVFQITEYVLLAHNRLNNADMHAFCTRLIIFIFYTFYFTFHALKSNTAVVHSLVLVFECKQLKY